MLVNKDSDTSDPVAVPVPPPKEKTLTSAQLTPPTSSAYNSLPYTDPPPPKRLILDSPPVVSVLYNIVVSMYLCSPVVSVLLRVVYGYVVSVCVVLRSASHESSVYNTMGGVCSYGKCV